MLFEGCKRGKVHLHASQIMTNTRVIEEYYAFFVFSCFCLYRFDLALHAKRKKSNKLKCFPWFGKRGKIHTNSVKHCTKVY